MPLEQNTPDLKLSIREWAKDDRPREKLMIHGPGTLSDAELVAILIRSGSAQDSALDLAKKILHDSKNDLNDLARCGVKDLIKFKGMGEAKAISIVAALELGRRRREGDDEEKPKINSSNDAFNIMHPVLGDLQHEEFWILLLDRGNRVVDKKRISQGGMHGTVADPKIIFKHALDARASSVIVCHNHPSGQLRPSEADIKLTHKLREAGGFLDITVMDHVIVTSAGHYSFADEGMLNR